MADPVLKLRADSTYPLSQKDLDDNFLYIDLTKLETSAVGALGQTVTLGTLPTGLTGRVVETDTIAEALVKLEYQIEHQPPLPETTNGGVPIGAMVGMRKETPNMVTVGGGTYLRSGVTAQASEYPDAPVTDSIYRTSNNSLSSVKQMAAGNGLVAAIPVNSSNQISVSSDNATTWRIQTLPATTTWASIIFGKGLFVLFSTGGNTCYTSPDCVTWTARTLPGGAATWQVSHFADGKFVLLSNPGNGVAVYSIDGITWELGVQPVAAAPNWMQIAYGAGRFVAVGAGSSNILTSADGITWTTVANALPISDYWHGVAYGNGMFLAICYGTNVSAKSTDGLTWTQGAMPTSAGWRDLAFGDGKFLTRATSVAAAYFTTDGDTWMSITLVGAPVHTHTYFAGFGFLLSNYDNGTVTILMLAGPYVDNLVAAFIDSATTKNRPLYMRVK